MDLEEWDESVRVLAAGFPDVLARMADDIDWTEELGDAMLAQTDDLLDAVQRMRAQAEAAGNLESNEAQTVEVEGDIISIAPADPQVVYVPAYDPQTVYTTPVTQPTVVYDDPGVSYGSVLTTGAIAFGSALLIDEIFDDDDDDWDDYWDNNSIDWDDDSIYPGRNVDIDGDVNINRGDVKIGDGDVEKRREERWEASRERRDEARQDIAQRSDQRAAGRGERQGEREGDRAGRQGEREGDRAARQGERDGDRAERQDGRAAAAAGAGAAAGAAAGAGARRDREGGGGARGDQRTQAEAKLKARTDGQGGNLHAAGERRPADCRPAAAEVRFGAEAGRVGPVEDREGDRPRRDQPQARHVAGRGEGAGAVSVEVKGGVEAEVGFEAEGSDGAEGSATQALGQQFGVQEAAEERLAREARPRAVGAAAAGAAAAGAGGDEEMTMRPGAKAGCWGVLSLVLLGGAAAADPAVFESPEAAVEAVVSALEARDREALIAVFGPENEDVVLTGDPEDDRATWGEFLRDYRALSRINREGDDLATLAIGRDLWPFPAPLVRDAAGWHFDAEAAREEVLLRRIGQNELDVIDLLRGYVDAQAAYRAMDPDGDGLPTLRGERAVERGHARRALLARRAGRAGEPGRRLHGAGGGRGLQRRGRRGRRARALPRLLLPHPDQAGAERARRARWTIWSTATWWPGTR